MRKNLTTKLAAFAVWSLTGPLAWGQQTAEMDWQAFGKKVTGRRIALVFPGFGCDVEADVTNMQQEAAVLRIVKTSDAVNCPKGQRTVARKELRTVRLIGVRVARIGLAILGGVGGYAAVVAGTFARRDEFAVGAGEAALFGASAVGGAVGGYYLGKHFSRDITIVVK